MGDWGILGANIEMLRNQPAILKQKPAGNNANPLKPEYSRDFIKIKAVLEKHRKKERTKQNERRIYDYIKKLILFADDEKPETIHEIVHKIGAIFLRNVDKNVQKRR
jgi:hypothetical protein